MNKEIKNLVKEIKSKFELLGEDYPKDNQAALDFNSRDIHSVLAYVKSQGFTQLSILTCVDWIKDNQFQLVFIVFNWKTGIRLQVRTRIDRKTPQFNTITAIYPGAQYYERDVHEFFGVEFIGNENSYKQLFLENWDDMPPLRKDFDSQAYSDKKYPVRKYKADFSKAGDK
ncbi:MAG: NADH-quinone oxidoreductase subunit C [Eubacteriales bacterium]